MAGVTPESGGDNFAFMGGVFLKLGELPIGNGFKCKTKKPDEVADDVSRG